MGHRRAKQGHNPIPGKVINGAFISVDLIHQDLKAAIHDLVDFLGIELLGDGCIIGHICK